MGTRKQAKKKSPERKKAPERSAESEGTQLEQAYSLMGFSGPMPAERPVLPKLTTGRAMLAADAARVEEPPAMGPEQLEVIEELLEIEPEETVARLQQAWDPNLTEDELRIALASARALVERPANFVPMLRARADFEMAAAPLPDNFNFPGMDLAEIPINPDDRKFEQAGDALGWIVFAAFPALFRGDKAKFRHADEFASKFEYTLQEPTPEHPLEVALFSDFGTGRYHSRYIAKQFRTRAVPYVIHLGDVYYAGRQSEFAEYFSAPLEPILNRSELFLLNSNHEMFSGGRWYFDFIDTKRRNHSVQKQEGSYFSLTSERFQIVGIDTAYHSNGRFPKQELQGWLRSKLNEGRSSGRTNILLSADHPYRYGENAFTKLFANDLFDVSINGLVDLWFWGNTHYCGLFDRSATARFVGSCVGHGGFPYTRKRKGEFSVVPVHFLESRARFPQSTRIRQDMGNNGYCLMSLHADGAITLRYFDWMSTLRCTAELRRPDPTALLTITAVTEHAD